jgi:hypothetical protein
MKYFLIVILTVFSLTFQQDVFAGESLPARPPAENYWTPEELALANTAKNASYLTEEEKKIIFYMNLVRMDGLRFFDTFFQEFVDAHNKDMRKYSNYNDLKISRTDKYYRGLEIDLKYIKDIGLLYPDESLSYVSKQHGKDMSRHNIAGHNSFDGRTMVDRINKFYPEKAMAENLAFGFSKGLANVSMLLLDKDVPDVGHRRNILNSTLGLNIVGVSIQSHPLYRFASITDFVAIPNLKI